MFQYQLQSTSFYPPTHQITPQRINISQPPAQPRVATVATNQYAAAAAAAAAARADPFQHAAQSLCVSSILCPSYQSKCMVLYFSSILSI